MSKLHKIIAGLALSTAAVGARSPWAPVPPALPPGPATWTVPS
ncbi:hypothetical protein [Microbispora sp. GKU 823]|nr:hypothetical protein [Microbispora sp. GKU 823]